FDCVPWPLSWLGGVASTHLPSLFVRDDIVFTTPVPRAEDRSGARRRCPRAAVWWHDQRPPTHRSSKLDSTTRCLIGALTHRKAFTQAASRAEKSSIHQKLNGPPRQSFGAARRDPLWCGSRFGQTLKPGVPVLARHRLSTACPTSGLYSCRSLTERGSVTEIELTKYPVRNKISKVLLRCRRPPVPNGPRARPLSRRRCFRPFEGVGTQWTRVTWSHDICQSKDRVFLTRFR